MFKTVHRDSAEVLAFVGTPFRSVIRAVTTEFTSLKHRGDSIGDIAVTLGVHRSSLYRELDRNTGQRGCRFQQAQEMASERERGAQLGIISK